MGGRSEVSVPRIHRMSKEEIDECRVVLNRYNEIYSGETILKHRGLRSILKKSNMARNPQKHVHFLIKDQTDKSKLEPQTPMSTVNRDGNCPNAPENVGGEKKDDGLPAVPFLLRQKLR